MTPWSAGTTYVPDVTNNPFHGYEWYKVPNQFQTPGTAPTTLTSYNPQKLGGMPITPATVTGSNALQVPTWSNSGRQRPILRRLRATFRPPGRRGVRSPQQYPPNLPAVFPTYDNSVNSEERSDGVNEADEMNLYVPNPLLDSPYGPTDLEWLYRQQDVDGAELTSRLSQLAPVSFSNTIDGQRRRRLFVRIPGRRTTSSGPTITPAASFNTTRGSAAVRRPQLKMHMGVAQSILPTPASPA